MTSLSLLLYQLSDFPGGLDGKASAYNVGRPRFNPWVQTISWRRKWQPTPVFLPGKSHGRWNLVGYSPWGRKESDTTERPHFLYFNLIRSAKTPFPNKATVMGPEYQDLDFHWRLLFTCWASQVAQWVKNPPATQEKVKVKVKSLSRVRLFATPWTIAYQVSLSMRFSRQGY